METLTITKVRHDELVVKEMKLKYFISEYFKLKKKLKLETNENDRAFSSKQSSIEVETSES